jgi:hypothetical protein
MVGVVITQVVAVAVDSLGSHRSRASLLAASTTVPDEAGPSEDIESLIDGTHKSLDPKEKE